MERLEEIKKLVLILNDILGEGFYDFLELNENTFRQYKSKIAKATDVTIIKRFIGIIDDKIQKLAKTRDIPKDNEIYCKDTGSDKLYIPFCFIDEYIHLLYLIIAGGKIWTIEEILKLCFILSINQDDSYLQQPDKNFDEAYKNGFIKEDEYKEFYENKRRNFREEYYSVCKDVVRNRKENSSFFAWPIHILSKTIKTENWNDDIISNRTIDRMKNKKGSRRWKTINDLISTQACERFKDNEEILKEYEVFQARILMAYFLENLVNSETLLQNFEQKDLYDLVYKGVLAES